MKPNTYNFIKSIKQVAILFLKKAILLAVLLNIFISFAYSQAVYPVQVNVNLIPPYSFYFEDYTSGTRDRIWVTLLNRDTQYPSMSVRLEMTIKANGFTVKTKKGVVVPPIIIEPNEPYRLSLDELIPYFDLNHLITNGIGSAAWQKNKMLPEGLVEFCFEVFDYKTGRILSLPGCGMAWLNFQKPPLLNLPFNGETISYNEPLNKLFQWTPRHKGLANVEYELIIKQLWDNGLKPEAAWAYSTEIIRETVKPTSFLYGSTLPPLTPGMLYAWAVRAIARDGLEELRVFENGGLSEIRCFHLEDYCPPPLSITSKTENGNIQLEWIPLPEHLDFTISYRQKDKDNSDWYYVTTTTPRITLYDIKPGYTYEYRIGTSCRPNTPVYGQTYTVTVSLLDKNNPNCGKLEISGLDNKEPLPYLNSGDMFMAGDFPVFVSQSIGDNGTFTGEGYVIMPQMFARTKLRVKWNDITINTDKRMIKGEIEGIYDESNSQIYNLDDIFEGGVLFGKVKDGITYTDVDLSFTIPDNSTFIFNADDEIITITDDNGGELGQIDVSQIIAEANHPKNSGKSIFPIIVKDKDGTIYKIDNPEDSDSSGNKTLVANKIGNSGNPLPDGSVNYTVLNSDKAKVSFSKGEGKYAFDTWISQYGKINLIRGKYEKLGDSYVPFKLIPTGRTDIVEAEIEIFDKSINPNYVVFKTPKGTQYDYKYENNKYTLTFSGGLTGDGQEIYALYPYKKGYLNLGKLVVVSYPEYVYNLVIVPVNNTHVDIKALEKGINKIYNPVGITWKLKDYKGFSYKNSSLNTKGSNKFSAYTPEMKALNKAYKEHLQANGESLSENAVYLFVLQSGEMKGQALAGDMPRGVQFGYLFNEGTSTDDLAQTAAHELGHGKLLLKHTFDYKIPEGSTNNLMDYVNHGTHIAKWQWDLIHDPGVVLRVFEKDEDGMFARDFDIAKILRKIKDAYSSNSDRIDISDIKRRRHTCFSYNSDSISLEFIYIEINGRKKDLISTKYRQEKALSELIHETDKSTIFESHKKEGTMFYIGNSVKGINIFVDSKDADRLRNYLFNGKLPLIAKVFDDKKQIEEDIHHFALITQTPKMPKIKIETKSDGYPDDYTVKLQLIIEYNRDGATLNGGDIKDLRNDSDSYPANGWKKLSLGEEWVPNFGMDIRGGKAYLLCKHDNSVDTSIFNIRGVNPSIANVLGYIKGKGHLNSYWFLIKLFKTESQQDNILRQFATGDVYKKTRRTKKENAPGEPLYGPPKGFGIGQLDNWNANGVTKYASSQHLWNWKENIEGAIEVIKQKEAFVKKRKKDYDKIISNWNDDNLNNPVSDTLYNGENDTTGMISITEGNEVFCVNPTGSQRDIYDAMLIRLYNGGIYYEVKEPGPKKRPRRYIYRTNKKNKNYVQSVCSKNNH